MQNIDMEDDAPTSKILPNFSGGRRSEPPVGAGRALKRPLEVRLDLDDVLGSGNMVQMKGLASSLKTLRQVRGTRIVVMTRLHPESVGGLLQHRGVLYDEVRKMVPTPHVNQDEEDKTDEQ